MGVYLYIFQKRLVASVTIYVQEASSRKVLYGGNVGVEKYIETKILLV
jgi:hypothetical protein